MYRGQVGNMPSILPREAQEQIVQSNIMRIPHTEWTVQARQTQLHAVLLIGTTIYKLAIQKQLAIQTN